MPIDTHPLPSEQPPPIQGERWYHAILNTYGSWIRADERGFRDHDHRFSSTGTYRDLPPPEQHRLLRDWVKRSMKQSEVKLRAEHRELVGRLLLSKLPECDAKVLALAVGSEHVHVLVRLPRDARTAKARIGNAKRFVSHQIRSEYPGTFWGKRCQLKPIRDYEHHSRTFGYILAHGKEGAWVWSYRDAKWRHDSIATDLIVGVKGLEGA